MAGTVQFEVTSFCNHKCLYCYNGDRNKVHNLENYSPEYYMRLTEKIVSLEPDTVVITGGESLAVIDKLWACIDYIQSKGIKVEINTNATLLTPILAEQLAKRKIGISVSFICNDKEVFDATTQIPGSFDRVVKGLQVALAAGLDIGTHMVVTKLNKNLVYDTAKYLSNMGIMTFSVSYANIPLYADQLREQLELNQREIDLMFWDMLKVRDQINIGIGVTEANCVCQFNNENLKKAFLKTWCMPGISIIAVSHTGEIRPCPSSSEVYGNILTDNLKVIFDEMKDVYWNKRMPQACLDCKDYKACGGGCRVESQERTGKLDGWSIAMRV